MDKNAIAAILEEMGVLLEIQGANPFKSRAFHNASRALESAPGDLAALIADGGLLEIKGIGKGIAAVITELSNTGSSKEYATLRESLPAGVTEMLRIEGLGPKRIKMLFDELKIASIEELEKAARSDRLSTLKGFGAKTQENILKGIDALRKRRDKTLYYIGQAAATELLSFMLKQKGVIRGEIAGSLRRRKEVIADIDLVIAARDAEREQLMSAFTGHPAVSALIARGETKSTVTLSSGVNCDLRIVTDEEFPFALQYFTGSKEHNVEIRSRAKKKGLSLNEYGFARIGQEDARGKARAVLHCREEADIYRSLGLAFVPPELRENMGEIEAAEAGTLPELITDSDVRGTFHCHTTYSDGTASVEEMARAAAALGWEYFGIGDHSKAAAYAGGLTTDKVKRQFLEIDAVNARLPGCRVLKGTECDILADGSLDWPDRVLASFDYVVVSVHSSFKLSEKEMTQRIINALKNKYVTMLGHPTGRLLLSREPYAVDMSQVIDAAADYGKAIEINAHPSRLDLDWRLCAYARKKEVLMVINPDAHSVAELRYVYGGVNIARKGWLSKENVLNCRPLAGVLSYLHL